VGVSRFRSRVGYRIRLQGILDGRRSLNRSSPGKTQRNEVASHGALLFPGVVSQPFAQNAFGRAVAYPHHLVRLLAFKTVVARIVVTSAAVAAGRGPPALRGSVVVTNLMAAQALD
jgi:hypothetical protein